MHYEVNNEHVKGIYTTKSRAKDIDELLAQSALYIKPEDYVLTYDCIPMFYYLTDTKPYMQNPGPGYMMMQFLRKNYTHHLRKPISAPW